MPLVHRVRSVRSLRGRTQAARARGPLAKNGRNTSGLEPIVCDMSVIGDSEFRELVAEAIDSLPDDLASVMDNVEVVVEDEPSRESLARLPRGVTLFGLYHGIPSRNAAVTTKECCPTGSRSTKVRSKDSPELQSGSRSRCGSPSSTRSLTILESTTTDWTSWAGANRRSAA